MDLLHDLKNTEGILDIQEQIKYIELNFEICIFRKIIPWATLVFLLCEGITGENIINISIKDLLDAGAHFGHKTNRWNLKNVEFTMVTEMGYILLDLQKTVIL